MNDGSGAGGVLFLRSGGPTDASNCLWLVDAASGTERLLVDPRELGSAGQSDVPPEERARRERAREASGGIVDYSTSRSGQVVAFAVDGQLWTLDVASGETRQLATQLSGIYDPQVSADASAVAFVAAGSVWAAGVNDPWVLDLVPSGLREGMRAESSNGLREGSREGHDDGGAVSFGVAEFVAAEEMGRTRGHWWSPDGASVALTRVDESNVAQWHLSEPALVGLPSRVIRYPAAGTPNADVELWVVAAQSDAHAPPASVAGSLAGSRPGPPTRAAARVTWDTQRFAYLVDVAWATLDPDEPAPLQLVVQSRDQRTLALLVVDGAVIADALTTVGSRELAATEVHTQTDPVWIDLLSGVPRLTARGVLSAANHDGVRALLLDGVPLTPPGHHVRSLVRQDDDAVIYTAPTAPDTVVAFRVALAAASSDAAARSVPAAPVAISDANGFASAVGGASAGEAQTAVVVQASLDAPTEYRVRQLAPKKTDGQQPSVTAAIGSLAAVPETLPTVTMLTSGEREVPTAVLWPSVGTQGAATEPLPILVDPYGGPHGQRVVASRGAFYEAQWLADQGFCVVVADGRGTPGKDVAWEQAVAGDLLTAAIDDQVAALDAVVERYGDRVDAARVGIRGWSFGGYLAAGAVCRRPDRFHAAIAGAPVTDWRLYDTHYTERYLGMPDAQPDAYERSSLLRDAGRLSRPLLLIHGFADDNVVAAHTLGFSAALLAAGVPHEVLPLSGVTHMATGAGVAQHLMTHQLDFLRRHLGVS